MPRRLKINMNRIISTEKMLTSFIVVRILARIYLKFFQLRASLKTRSRRTPLKADRAPVGESSLWRDFDTTKSTTERMTIKASKRLKVSRAYIRNPSPKILMIISTAKATVNTSLRDRAILVVYGSSGYPSRAKTAVLPTIRRVMTKVKLQ